MRMTWRRLAGGSWRAGTRGRQAGPSAAGPAGATSSVPSCLSFPQANAPSCDRLEDLASLVYLNESSVLHTLRQRSGTSLLHTYAGPSLLVLSPRGTPAVYSEKVRCPRLPGCLTDPRATSHLSGFAPSPPHPPGLLSTLTADLGKESSQGVGTEALHLTASGGQDLASICISLCDRSVRIPQLPWSERPRKEDVALVGEGV